MKHTDEIIIKLIATSDVHGCIFPYDYINRQPLEGSLARVFTYIKNENIRYDGQVVLLDNGDILQGQPTCYYNNYVSTEQPNLAARVYNYMGYDAQTIGNHDVETGHPVYDKWIAECEFPMLGANVIDAHTGQPYLQPYTIVERSGIRIAVLGLLTAAIPHWLHHDLWHGLRFEEMTATARHWTKVIHERERPDLLVGLFHSGKEGGITTPDYEENATQHVVSAVEGFDLVFYGHDHLSHNDWIDSPSGHRVLCLAPSSNAHLVAEAEVRFDPSSHALRSMRGGLRSVKSYTPDPDFTRYFQPDADQVKTYIERVIGRFAHTLYTRDCYFGSAPLTDFIHDVQLKVTGADISLNAPLTFDTRIKAGDVRISDLFNLYKYENQIYVLRMTGHEIHQLLEMSYGLWVGTMHSPDDHIILLSESDTSTGKRYLFDNLAFNFESAAGIDYEVDVTRPRGERVHIMQMSNGEPFSAERWYHVAMNSYRGNGGGELLTKGAGIPFEQITERIVYRSEHDQRYYLMHEIEEKRELDPQAHDNWRFVPETWARPALERDKKLLFGGDVMT